MSNQLVQKDPYRSVSVDRLVTGGTEITWSMNIGFDAPAPWSFTVQWSERGDPSTWEDVAMVGDNFVATDTDERQRGVMPVGNYRVVLVDGDGRTHESYPTGYPDQWSPAQLRMAREIRRREHRRFEVSGDKCWVLFRRHWGPTCSVCTSPTTGEVRDPRCQTCYGTGVEGGYFSPYPAECLITGHEGRVMRHLGTTIYENMTMLMSIIPKIREDDVIILDGSDARMEVKRAKPTCQIRGKAISEMVSLSAVEPKDVLYDITWNGSNDPAAGEIQL